MIRTAILLLFFGSGATALVYEVVWSKYLSLMFGSTVQAQTVVLAVFMGGLALGNRLLGAWADRAPRPLAVYGYFELAIGLYAVGFRWFNDLADQLFVSLGAAVLGHGLLLLLLKGALSIALLLVPTVLMGGTLPLLAAWLQRSTTDPGRRSARFYSTNSLGAVCGAALAGFFLVESLGLRETLGVTALVNAFIGLTAIVLSGRATTDASANAPSAASPAAAAKADTGRNSVRVACLVVALTGAVSMGMEVLASRCLVLIFGASLQAFAVVLMAFILGIGLGSAVIASPRFHWLRREATTVVLLLVAAGMIGLFILTIENWVELYRHVKTGLARTEMGFALHQVFITGLSLVVLGVPAALLGAVLPLWIRGVSAPGASLADQVGRLLTWNTLGAVVGVMLTGFVLMPQIGLRGAFGVLALALCVAAGLIARAYLRRKAVLASAGMVVALGLVCWLGGEGWRLVLSSGVFRARETTVDRFAMDRRRQHFKLLFYEDAADATVSVEKGDGIGAPPQLSLRINGKVDASSEGDLATQYLLGHLPLLARPESKDVFVLGFGSGITAGAVLGHPIDRLTIAENCAPVLRAGRLFKQWNRDVLNHPRTQIWNEDARTVLKLSPQLYDAIISEPSNPWMVGVGSVFSREFYELAASRLKPGGVMTQWFHLYEMSDDIVELVLRSFRSVFPYVEIWDAGVGDIILLGSTLSWRSDPSVYQKVYDRPEPRHDLESVGLPTADSVWARQLASQRTAFAIPGGGAIQSDEFPVLEYEAPKAFFRGENSRLLAKFDERTWESAVAGAQKQAVLGSLERESLRRIFGEYSSANPDVAKYISVLARPRERFAGDELYDGELPIPFAFGAAEASRQVIPVPDGATEELRRLLAAEALLWGSADRWREGAEAIREILKVHKPGKSRDVDDWPPVRFAGAAVKACLARGDLPLARTILPVGLKYRHAEELRYLARIVERESTLANPRVTASSPVP